MALIDGVKLSLGGRDFIVPALTLKSLRKLTESGTLKKLNVTGGELSLENMDAVATVVHAAISRNYSDVTVDDLLELLDLENMQRVLPAVMAASGLKRDTLGEVQGPKT